MAATAQRVILVTGGGTGIGKAIAMAFGVGESAFVYVTSRREDALLCTVQELTEAGGSAHALPADVADAQQVADLMEVIHRNHGGLDVLVNAAGALHLGALHETSEEDFDQIMDTNVKGVWLVSKLAIPMMRHRANANIINISSIAASRSEPGIGVYQASKAAVNSLTRVMAKELASAKIRVNAIAPGPVDTELYSGSVLGDDLEVERRRTLAANAVPFGRLGTPEEVARLAVFLASPESDFISGSVHSIDGGMGY